MVMGRKLSRMACQMADRYLVTYTAAQLYIVTVSTKLTRRSYEREREKIQ